MMTSAVPVGVGGPALVPVEVIDETKVLSPVGTESKAVPPPDLTEETKATPAVRGTGDSDLIPFLKTARAETEAAMRATQNLASRHLLLRLIANNKNLSEAYNKAITALVAFRRVHIFIVQQFILNQMATGKWA